jgi:hypothetical protein
MSNYTIGGTILVISIIVFYLLVRFFNVVPKRYHESIRLIGSLSIIVVVSGTFFTYYKEKQEQKKRANKEYAESILKGFDDIDNILIGEYDKNELIFDIIYNKIQIPSSTNEDLHKKVINMSKRDKNMLYLTYSKITSLFEKMYLTNPDLFDNENLGIKVRMYVDNMFYYEFWNSTKYIYNKNFVNFIQDKFVFLTIGDYKYFKPDRLVNNIPYINDALFIFESPKYDNLWYKTGNESSGMQGGSMMSSSMQGGSMMSSGMRNGRMMKNGMMN